ncbi:iron complex outermembrane receptor protein [Altererythrobacter atlanticus]|uniref:Pesticin receptor n=1 Tax=Croceibacterium atlanticum TaxID=1267766 RepID=A0A0F7KP12_9SPHN|nr:TonB-dependent receptor [Croceibacterium atlanticum]AKH42253.1 Pesticin receptor precursor [Croceibacterium atlanticum]MBB5731029.1 iron complex outermembrane receptor protein [Croceibacterium atlanticum]
MNFRTRPNSLKSIYGATVASLALVAATPALAQDQAAEQDDAGASDDYGSAIVVTAQFREQNLQETPIAITAVNAATLDARGQGSVEDLGDFAPNVALEPATGLQGNSIAAFIRGIGQADASFALEPGVGIYIDDIYYGTTFGAVMDLTDLDRVEVLRGPQGTLAGKNSVGGAVKLYTEKPDGSGDGFIEATYGRFDRLDFRGSADFTIAEDLFARVSGVSKSSDGYMTRLDYGCVYPDSGIPTQGTGEKDCKLGTEGGRDLQAVRLALRYAPYDSPFEINLRADYASDNSETVASKLIYADNPNVRFYDADNAAGGIPFDSRFITGPESYTTYATYGTGGNYTTDFGTLYQVAPGGFQTAPKASTESWGLSGKVDVELSPTLNLTSITGYRVADGSSGIDVDGAPVALLLQDFNYRHEQFTQEVRLSAEIADGLIDATVGGFYYDANDTLSGRTAIPTLLFDFYQKDAVTNRSVSAFGHAEINVTDRLGIVAGVRYTDDKKVYKYTRTNVDGTQPSGIPLTENWLIVGLDGLQGEFVGDRFDYRIGANYDVTDDVMVYAQVATGFKGGGINPRPSAPDQVQDFGPEKVTTYEAGFKSELLDSRVRLNGAVFLNDYSDIQLVRYQCPQSVVNACSIPSNAGDAEIFGFELEGFFEPVDNFQIDASVGYLDFDYTEITNPSTLVTEDMIAPFISKWQASAGVQYVAEFNSGATVTPRLDWSYRTDFFYNSINNPYNLIDGYHMVNGRVTYDSADGNWSLSAAVSNLFDKFYYTGKAENLGSYGVVTGNPGRPREWSFTLRRNF